MTDELLPYYEKELAFIRQMGAEFANEHPKIASSLGINAETIEDPHVSRLIESFAYLNARIQHRLDDDLPEISDALMEVIFPHYHRPLPPMTIVQFQPDREKLESSYTVKRQTELDSESFGGESCRFTTVYDTLLHPFEVNTAKVMGLPFSTPGASQCRGAQSVVRISLKTLNPDIHFSEVSPELIRFYLKGQAQHVNPLYEMLLNQCQAIFMSTGEADTKPMRLPLGCLKPVGFDKDQGLLPYPDSSFMGYRLLTEYFAFPEKFMFFDITDFAEKLPKGEYDQLDLYFYLAKADVELEHHISARTFQLGCTPAINLFEHSCDPIKVKHTQNEYQIVPDARRPAGYEIYSIDNVTATDSSGNAEEYLPVYGIDHANQQAIDPVYWFSARRHAKLGYDQRDEGTDVHLSLIDLHFNPNNPDDRTLLLKTLCSNRDQVSKLPFSAEQPRLQGVDIAPPCSKILCITQPTASVRPSMRNNSRWKLISHLSLNHLSLTGAEDTTRALKEILRLYDFKDSSINRAQIQSINHIKTAPITAPLMIDGRSALCRGIEIDIELDTLQMTGSSSYLFASVLEHFFALYASINSFTRVLIRLKNKEGYLKKCPPRAGEKVLL